MKIAVILAAGRGSRLKEECLEQPKPMTKVNGVSIIDNLIKNLIIHSVKEIVIVTGYMEEKLNKHLHKFKNSCTLHLISNKIYDSTNNIYSLWLAKEYLKDGFFLFEADIFFEPLLIEKLIKSTHRNVIVVDEFTSNMNGTVVELTVDSIIKEMYLSSHQSKNFDFYQKFKTVNIYKLSKYYTENYFLKKLEKHIKRGDINIYYEQIIKEDIDDGHIFYGLKTKNIKWWEIDTQEDLQITRRIFSK